ncbi:DUF4439 domain-containing protein [Corynebacterium accolens]|uniref:DUF4439 domain-containing protein n=1 Tax=Corynebacterium accolens TaxID=38284 RepID=UPI0003135660|nr:DUF4439 domain-containing protein [Corynebacterium accolens]MDK4266396.1 DUF4439 domain-containing protein [Corynebacterium accolens]MDK4275893.1 DUF4439 domain-containing protein [Corynebacterium accolens]MDK4308023.1 DUF4439 domain-containing protein [Corynebacterium accolens]WKS56063.1 ferritin-like domain-containing protein [Corynebacterium accolens]
MNRRRIALTCVASTATLPALAGCSAVDSVVDYFGPRPEDALERLAVAAASDGLALQGVDDEAADMRSSQADALFAEIARLCGTDDQGNVPHSCEVDRPTQAPPATDSSQVLEEAAAATTEAADEVSSESRPIVTQQAITLNAWLPGDAPDIPTLSQPQRESATDLLQWEYEQVFGLDFARAYSDPAAEGRIDKLLSLHHHRIDQLQEAISQNGEVPQPEPAYSSGGTTLPGDADSAAAFLDTLMEQDADKWHAAAVAAAQQESPNQEWLNWLIGIAAESQAA